MPDRRQVLQAAISGAALTVWPRALHAAIEPERPRLVVVILRGGLDGLHALPPVGDPDYARLRGDVALTTGGDGAAIKLDELFALHPALPTLGRFYTERSLIALHAVATPYRERSHFDAQDLLESGAELPHTRSDGWLNRALQGLPAGVRHGDLGIALAPTLPLLLRGSSAVGNWSPSTQAAPDDGFLTRVEHLYAADPVLAAALVRARDMNAIADDGSDGGDSMAAGAAKGARRGPVVPLARAAAQFLLAADGPSVAVLDLGGWDSHSGAFNANGSLTRALRQLDAGILALHDGLGDAWARTAVLVVTEFGRTVRPNGTGGTDHGTATCAFVVGGAVRGGRVLANWPGLKPGDLRDDRDLRPTTDLRAVAKGLLLEHLGIAEAVIETAAFPDSRTIRPMSGLISA